MSAADPFTQFRFPFGRRPAGGDEDDETGFLNVNPDNFPHAASIQASANAANAAFDNMDADTAAAIQDALDMGIMQGMNPLQLANYLSFLVGPQRADAIARSEMLGAYRDAALGIYNDNSDVVGNWMWSAAAGACVACMEEDGTIHDLTEDMDGMTHTNCRCSPIPITQPWQNILGPLGIDVSDIEETSILDDYEPMSETFSQMPFEQQADILGSKSAAEAVSQGLLEPGDFVGHIEGGAYDGALYVKSLREALADQGLSTDEIASVKSDLLAAVRNAPAAPEAAEARTAEAALRDELAQAQARLDAAQAKIDEINDRLLHRREGDYVSRDEFHEANVEYLTARREVERLGGNVVSEEERTKSFGTLEEITAREAQVEAAYGGMVIGDPTALEEEAFGKSSGLMGYSDTPLGGADPRIVASVERGREMLDNVINTLATRLEGDGAYARLMRYLGYDRDAVYANLTTVENAKRAAETGRRTLDAEEARLAAMTRQEALAWARQETYRDSVHELFEAFHGIPTGSDNIEMWVQSPLQIAMQDVVKQEFGLKTAEGYWSDEAIAAARAEWGTYRNGLRSFFRAMYDETQAWFKDQGITDVQLFRGLRWEAEKAPTGISFDGKVVESVVQQAPMTSWASNAEVALDYARDIGGAARPATAAADYGMLLATRVPVEQILSTPFTGFGTPTLREMIVLGKPDTVLALPFEMEKAPTLDTFLERLAGETRAAEVRGSGDAAGAFGRGAAEDALTARIDRIPADATVADVQDYIQAHIPGVGAVDLMSLDAQTARLIGNATVNLIEQLPVVGDNLVMMSAQPIASGAVAFVPASGRALVLNVDVWTDLAGLAAQAQSDFARGWWVSQVPEDMLGHELGHLLMFTHHISDDAWANAMGRVLDAGGRPFVSTYGARNYKEAFAETFALLVYGDPTPEQLPIAREMAQILRDEGIDFESLRAAVGMSPLDLGAGD